MSSKKYALITGGSRGIGKALAAQLASRGYHLLIVATTEALLQTTAKELEEVNPAITVQFKVQDLSSSHAVKDIVAWTQPYHKNLEIVINNAGFGLSGGFIGKSLEKQLSSIDVNFRALVELSHAFIPILAIQPKAYLLNVASTAAYQPVPYLSVYAATKAAVLSFSRGLRQELKDSTISVSCLSPGSTDTYFADRAEMNASIKKVAKKFNMSPEAVAQIAIKGLFRGKAEIIPGVTNQLNAFLPRLFPKVWIEKIAGSIYNPNTHKESK